MCVSNHHSHKIWALHFRPDVSVRLTWVHKVLLYSTNSICTLLYWSTGLTLSLYFSPANIHIVYHSLQLKPAWRMNRNTFSCFDAPSSRLERVRGKSWFYWGDSSFIFYNMTTRTQSAASILYTVCDSLGSIIIHCHHHRHDVTSFFRVDAAFTPYGIHGTDGRSSHDWTIQDGWQSTIAGGVRVKNCALPVKHFVHKLRFSWHQMMRFGWYEASVNSAFSDNSPFCHTHQSTQVVQGFKAMNYSILVQIWLLSSEWRTTFIYHTTVPGRQWVWMVAINITTNNFFYYSLLFGVKQVL